MKKLGCVVLILLTAFRFPLGAHGATIYEPTEPVNSDAALLYNLDTDTVIYSKNETDPKYPASLTKIMTCILALENTQNLDTEMVTYPTYVQDELYRYQVANGSVSLGGLVAGEELTMRQALYAIMLSSANEASMSIADHIGGSQEGFVRMMNQRAKELGAKNTNFVNPNGLFDEKHVTTAYDMAQITLHAIELPGFMDIVSTATYESGPTNVHENLTWSTTNYLMIEGNSYYNSNVQGVKTGSLPESGRCFISTATKSGYRYLLVLMDAPYYDEDGNAMNANLAFTDANNIYKWVFETFVVQTVKDQGEHVGEIEVRFNLEQDKVLLVTAERFSALVPRQVTKNDVVVKPLIPEYIDAPVTKGQHVGEGILMLAGEEIGRVDLLAYENVSVSNTLVFLDKAKGILQAIAGNFLFKFLIIFLVLLILFYIFVMIQRNKNRKRKGGYRPRRRI